MIKSEKSDYLYIGSTNDLKRRISEHNEGQVDSTRPYRPFELQACVGVRTKDKARKLEEYFKTGSGKAVLKKRIL